MGLLATHRLEGRKVRRALRDVSTFKDSITSRLVDHLTHAPGDTGACA